MKNRFFDQATLLKDEGAKTKAFFSRRGSLDSLSDAHALVSTGEPSSVRFLRAFRFFHSTNIPAFATALSSSYLTPLELDLLVTASCGVITTGFTNRESFFFVLKSAGVSDQRISLIKNALENFDFIRSASDYFVSPHILGLCEGKFSEIMAALTSFGFDRKIDRTLLVASAIEKFDQTLALYDGFPIPLYSGSRPFPDVFREAHAPLVSRIGAYSKAGLIPLESDLLDLLESRFDPESIVSSKPPRIPSAILPTYSPSGIVTPGQLVGYRGVDFDPMEIQSRPPEYRLFVLLCTCLTMACGNAVPPPDVIRALGESFTSPKDPQKRDD